MTKLQSDHKNLRGEWVQRSHIEDRYVWTVSGVLWNNIKERCTLGGATQTREPTYVGCKNSFPDFQSFVEWHRQQTGYGLGYQLDADILKDGDKEYSEIKCLLIPSALNKFIQSSKGRRGKYPQGMYLRKWDNKLHVRIEHGDTKTDLGLFTLDRIEDARQVYKKHKDIQGKIWYHALVNKEYIVDDRVTEYMKTWEHLCDWDLND